MESFVIAVELKVDNYEYNSVGILSKVLQKSHKRGVTDNMIILNSFSLKYTIKNSDILLERMASTYTSEIFRVWCNDISDDDTETDDISDVYDFVKDIISKITEYSYSCIETGVIKKASIQILDIKQI